MKKIWHFSLVFEQGTPRSCGCDGITTDSIDDMQAFAEIVGWSREIKSPCRIQVEEPEGSQRLSKLLDLLKLLYGYEPYPRRIIPPGHADRFFGVARAKHYTDGEMAAADFLRLILCRARVAEHVSGTDEPGGGTIIARAKKSQSPFGWVMPPLFAMTAAFRDHLVTRSFAGFDPVPLGGTELWRLGSSIILPVCLLPRQNEQGQDAGPDDPGPNHWDDEGSGPVELRYSRKEVQKLLPLDIAFSHERSGTARRMLFREVIVSQRFRTAMLELGVKDLQYAPVRLVE